MRKPDKIIYGGIRWELALQKRLENEKYLEQYGFKVFSQNDEDGIISEIFERIGITNKTFIEFGVQDGFECNTHYLLLLGWSGLWIEASSSSVQSIQEHFSDAIDSQQLRVSNSFIDRDNIDQIIKTAEFSGEIDLLSVDIDGNDYHVLEAITQVNPRVIIVEYNALFPPDCNWIMPYNPTHQWGGDNYSGASLLAFEKLMASKGYQLVGTNINGVNAFFVCKDLAGDLFPLPATAHNLYNPTNLGIKHKTGGLSDFFLNQSIKNRPKTGKYPSRKKVFFSLPRAIVTGVSQWVRDKRFPNE